MANWCSNSLAIYGDRLQVEELFKDFEAAFKHTLYLRNLIDYFDLDGRGLGCRGELWERPIMQDGAITFGCETAWGPYEDLWEEILKFYPALQYVFTAEEPGCEVYINSDTEGKFFTEKYRIESYDGEISEYLDSDDALIKLTEEITGVHAETVEQCFKAVNKYNKSLGEDDDKCISLHAFETP